MLTVGTAVNLGFKALGMLGKKGKSSKETPLQAAARGLASSGYQTSSIATPGRPDTGGVKKAKGSAEMYDYYRMVATAKLVADRLDPESGTRVGKLGAIKESSIG